MTAEHLSAPPLPDPPRLVGPALVTTRAAIWDARWRLTGRVAVVPTMGALHDGHVALIRAARQAADAVVVTIFVNPLQFGAGEDLDRYPRDLDADLERLRARGRRRRLRPVACRRCTPRRPGRAGRRRPARRAVRGVEPARSLRRGAHRRAQAAPPLPAPDRRLRREGRPAAGPRPAHGGRPRPAGTGPGGADRARAGRPRPVQPQPLPRRRAATERGGRLRRALLAGAAAGPGGASAVLNTAREVLCARARHPARLPAPGDARASTTSRSPSTGRRCSWSLPTSATTRLIDNIAVTLGSAPDQEPPREHGAGPAGRPGPGAARPADRPAPGWTSYADVMVVGSGIAGLTVALRSAASGSVLLVTKDVLAAGSTRWAQGGIAAALGPGDTPEAHRDRHPDRRGRPVRRGRRRRARHRGPRVRARADRSRRAVRPALRRRAVARPARAVTTPTASRTPAATPPAPRSSARWSTPCSPTPASRSSSTRWCSTCCSTTTATPPGATLHVMGEGARDGVGAVHARAVVLATGGIGQVYSATTNPAVSTGDGVALALRAGAAVRDLEFVQFHPTVMWLGSASKGQQPLVSEAVRGEGAFLVDDEGRRFMQGVHPLADLAPRDVVAKAIMRADARDRRRPRLARRPRLRRGEVARPGSRPSSPAASTTASTRCTS